MPVPVAIAPPETALPPVGRGKVPLGHPYGAPVPKPDWNGGRIPLAATPEAVKVVTGLPMTEPVADALKVTVGVFGTTTTV